MAKKPIVFLFRISGILISMFHIISLAFFKQAHEVELSPTRNHVKTEHNMKFILK